MTSNEPGLFSSRRERRLWIWALAVVGAIYATADLARGLGDFLRENGWLGRASLMFSGGALLVLWTILIQGLRERSRGIEIGFVLGVLAIVILGLARALDASERSHLIEYAVLSLIIYEALFERKLQGRRVPVPPLLAIALTTLVGVVDECIQYFVPSRTFDWFDIAFDLLASIMAVGASVTMRFILRWVLRRFRKLDAYRQ